MSKPDSRKHHDELMHSQPDIVLHQPEGALGLNTGMSADLKERRACPEKRGVARDRPVANVARDVVVARRLQTAGLVGDPET